MPIGCRPVAEDPRFNVAGFETCDSVSRTIATDSGALSSIADNFQRMREGLLELVGHVVLLVLYGVGALVTGFIGLLIEYQSYVHAIGGEYRLATWLGVIGGIVLLFGYLIVRDKVLPTVRPA